MESAIQISAGELDLLAHGQPLRVRVNDSQEAVLVLAEQYERLKKFVDTNETDPRVVYPLIADISPEDWEDLSAYPNAEML